MSNQPFVMQTTIIASAAKVWQALTDSNEMKEWYFDIRDFKAQEGFEFTFNGGTEEHQYVHRCKVTEVVPIKKLTYSWRYGDYPGNSFVTFELFGEGNTTRLQLTHDGIETLGPGNPDFARKNFEEGWAQIIGTSLKEYLEK
jgi:uncharacterized protein YndB with AHSA1/START domain